jgi:hypothetical protein
MPMIARSNPDGVITSITFRRPRFAGWDNCRYQDVANDHRQWEPREEEAHADERPAERIWEQDEAQVRAHVPQ